MCPALGSSFNICMCTHTNTCASFHADSPTHPQTHVCTHAHPHSGSSPNSKFSAAQDRSWNPLQTQAVTKLLSPCHQALVLGSHTHTNTISLHPPPPPYRPCTRTSTGTRLRARALVDQPRPAIQPSLSGRAHAVPRTEPHTRAHTRMLHAPGGGPGAALLERRAGTRAGAAAATAEEAERGNRERAGPRFSWRPGIFQPGR